MQELDDTQMYLSDGLKYDREWEPVYQAFLQHPLAQEVLASPERDNTKMDHCKRISKISFTHSD